MKPNIPIPFLRNLNDFSSLFILLASFDKIKDCYLGYMNCDQCL